MSEPTLAPGEPADLAEQSRDLVPEDDAEEPVDLAWETDPADALEQRREVGFDDDDEPAHDA
jgi:hypothetical protein